MGRVEQFIREFKEMVAVQRLAFVIYEKKKDAAARAGTLRMCGLFGPDPLASEALKEAAALVRGTNY